MCYGTWAGDDLGSYLERSLCNPARRGAGDHHCIDAARRRWTALSYLDSSCSHQAIECSNRQQQQQPAKAQPLDCECAKSYAAIVICNPVTKTAYMHLGYCMSYVEELNATVFGTCIYNNYQIFSDYYNTGTSNNASSYDIVLRETHAYYPLERNKSQLPLACAYLNRRGKHCGKCLEGYAPPSPLLPPQMHEL